MISIDVLITRYADLDSDEIDRWIGNDWVRPDGHAGQYQFRDIDVARIRLIQELRVDLQVNEAALPIVLSLLDQIYDMRRRLHQLGTGLDRMVTADVREQLALYLSEYRA